MSLLALFGTFETGLVYALVALGVLLSFRVLDFPDLTADGSFPLGAFACAVAMTAGIHPVLAIGIGFAAGAAAGVLTAWLHVKLGILQLLAGIIVMTALYSINLRIGDAPNVSLLGQKTIFDLFTPVLGSGMWQNAAVLLLITLLIKFVLNWFFSTETGLAMRATGANPRMARVITLSVVIGSIVYRLFIMVAMGSETLSGLGLKTQDLNLITSVLVVCVMMLPKIKAKLKQRSAQP